MPQTPSRSCEIKGEVYSTVTDCTNPQLKYEACSVGCKGCVVFTFKQGRAIIYQPTSDPFNPPPEITVRPKGQK